MLWMVSVCKIYRFNHPKHVYVPMLVSFKILLCGIWSYLEEIWRQICTLHTWCHSIKGTFTHEEVFIYKYCNWKQGYVNIRCCMEMFQSSYCYFKSVCVLSDFQFKHSVILWIIQQYKRCKIYKIFQIKCLNFITI